MKQTQNQKCAISAETFKRIYLLAIIGSYRNGVYGLKRLQKVTYLSELESPIKPYTFKRHRYGQYSEELADINNSLIELNYIVQSLPQGQCCAYSLSNTIDVSYYKDILSKIDPELIERIRETIDEFGYLPEDKLIDLCYSISNFKKKKSGDVVLKADIPDSLQVLGLTVEQCDELELAFSTSFIKSMSTIVDGLSKSAIDIDKVEKVAIKV